MKRMLSVLFLALFCLCGCGETETQEGLSVVAVSFPGYSFAKEIVGDFGEVTMLLPLGAEAHGYEPTPKDMLKIQDCDVFIYGGGASEHWVEEVLSSTDGTMQRVAMTDCVPHLEGDHEGHDHGADEHVWTDPVNAMEIAKAIGEAVCKADPENRGTYEKNTKDCLARLQKLNEAYADALLNTDTEIVMADRFPFLYLAERYGLSYRAAFPGCAGESEPSAATVAELIDYVKQNKIPVVYYTEFSNHEVADILCETTGAKALMLHSCHNVSVEDFQNGASYFSLMEQNLEHLKEAR